MLLRITPHKTNENSKCYRTGKWRIAGWAEEVNKNRQLEVAHSLSLHPVLHEQDMGRGRRRAGADARHAHSERGCSEPATQFALGTNDATRREARSQLCLCSRRGAPSILTSRNVLTLRKQFVILRSGRGRACHVRGWFQRAHASFGTIQLLRQVVSALNAGGFGSGLLQDYSSSQSHDGR